MPEAPTSLDLYLIGTMRDDPVLRRLAVQHGVSDADVRAMLGKTAGFNDATQITEERVRSLFGRPELEEPGRLAYALAIWPAHVFRWGLHLKGLAYHEGFALRIPDAIADLGYDLGSALDVLRPWYHTREHAEELLGAPALDQSWGSIGEWYYGPTAGGDDVLLQFDYCLLTRVVRKAGMIAELR
jgi:hypothetical protein